MNEALLISNAVLWVLVLALVVVAVALTRQIGILYERVAPMGALMLDQGPKVGDAAPAFQLDTLQGSRVAIAQPGNGRSQLLFFLSPTCPVCKKLLPVLKSISGAESSWLQLVFASDGERPAHAEFQRKAGLTDYPYVLSQDLGMAFKVGRLPYAVLIDADGRVRAKGLVNSREQVESLFEAQERGVASVQAYLDQAA